MYTAAKPFTLHALLIAILTLTSICKSAVAFSPYQRPFSPANLLLGDDPPKAPKCDCTDTANDESKMNLYVCGDARLGPVSLPSKFPLLAVVNNYDRFGGLKPGDFLKKWWNASSTPPGWIWPPKDGWLLDIWGERIQAMSTIPVGTRVDRFGSEGGQYLAAAEAPFDQRSLPPNSLNSDDRYPEYPNAYHVYKVVRPLTVLAGPLAGWFGQAGLGAQYYTGYVGRVIELVNWGYIERVNLTNVDPPGSKDGCGR